MKEGQSRQEETIQAIKAEAIETTELREGNTKSEDMKQNVKNLVLKDAKKDKSEEIDVLHDITDTARILIDELKIRLNYKILEVLVT